jgi:hypothetical protein
MDVREPHNSTRSRNLTRAEVLAGVPRRVNAMFVFGMLLAAYELAVALMALIELSGHVFASVYAWVWIFGGYAIGVAVWSLIVAWTSTTLRYTHAHHDFKLYAHYKAVLFKAVLGLALIWGFYARYNDAVLGGTGSVIDDFRDAAYDGPLYTNTAEYAVTLNRAYAEWTGALYFVLVTTLFVVYTAGEAGVAHIVIETMPHATEDGGDNSTFAAHASSPTSAKKARGARLR